MSAPSTSSFSVITVTCYRRKIWLLYPFLAIYKASAVWVSLRSMLGRARGTRVFDIASFAGPLAYNADRAVQTVRWEKINSADGTMNKRTTVSYFLIFGVPYHLILHGKFRIQGSELGLGNLVDGLLVEGGFIFGPRIFLGFVGNPRSLWW